MSTSNGGRCRLPAACGDFRPARTALAVGAIWAGLAAGAFAQGSAATDRDALEALYHATGGPNWTNSTNWLSDAPLYEWLGVETNVGGRVTGLDLDDPNGRRGSGGGNNLKGVIPPELGALSELEVLELNHNALRGPIPAELGNLTNLQTLALYDNALSGPIPAELGNLGNLESLFLGENQLSGPIPAELGNGSNLELLRLNDNALRGPIPAEFGNLGNLRRLWLHDNELSGAIPAELGNLSGLEWLFVDRNPALAGPSPRNLMQLSAFGGLGISRTNACVPADAEFQAWVADLDHYYSSGLTCDGLLVSFTRALYAVVEGGTIPVTVHLSAAEAPGRAVTIPLTDTPGGGATAADYAGVPANVIFGPTETTQTFVFEARADTSPDAGETVTLGLGEPLPPGVMAGNPTTATVTLADYDPVTRDREAIEALYHATDGPNWSSRTNWLSDEPLSTWAGVRTNGDGRVTRLNLDHNRLSGVLPAALGDLTALEELRLGHNRLHGPIPPVLERLDDLEVLYLIDNHLSGEIPSGVGSLANLDWLLLYGNPLSGPMPRSLTQLSTLERLDIEDTGVCVPNDAAFQAWLDTIALFRSSGLTCGVSVTVAFGSTRYTVGEGESVPVAVRLSQAPGRTVTITLTDTPGGGATAADYAGVPPNLTFGPAEVVRTFRVGAHADADPDTGETVTLGIGLPLPDGVTAEPPATATVTLADDPDGAAMDRAVLEVLYRRTGGANWRDRANWLSDAPLHQWFGVETDDSGRVTRLELWNNNLTGAIPPELGDLANLLYLELSANNLTGTIPPELGDLTNLEMLSLGYSYWYTYEAGRTIPPELGSLANLRELWLAANNLTGAIPPELGDLANLQKLVLHSNDLTGAIPPELGDLINLRELQLSDNHLTGSFPPELGRLTDLEKLYVQYNLDLSGPFPLPLRSPLSSVDLHFTQVCVPPADAAFQAWVDTAEFGPSGLTCGASAHAVSAIDVAVFYTPAARAAAGGTAAIEALIDLMVAETNQAYRDSGVQQRVALAARQEVQYTEADSPLTDLGRLERQGDGHMDEVHAIRDRVGADLVHLIAVLRDVCGIAQLASRARTAFGVTAPVCGGSTFAHELGHNMGLQHDRYVSCGRPGYVCDDRPTLYSYGYVNQRAFGAGAPQESQWFTIMAYNDQCTDEGNRCQRILRFSNPAQTWSGDPLGVPGDLRSHRVDGPSDAVRLLNVSRHAVASFRDIPGPNRPPVPVGTLLNLRLPTVDGVLGVDVSGGFVDPDGDALVYMASSLAPQVVTVRLSGSRVWLTAVSAGTAAIRVTATDPGGLSATQAFTVSVAAPLPFTDDPIQPEETPIRAVHFTELRTRIDALRRVAGLAPFGWTDPLRAGVTPVRLVHLLELRAALAAMYTAAGRVVPSWTDGASAAGAIPIRAVHLMELRAAVVALE